MHQPPQNLPSRDNWHALGTSKIDNLLTICKRYGIGKNDDRLRRVGRHARISAAEFRRASCREILYRYTEPLRHLYGVAALQFFASVVWTRKDRDTTDLRHNFTQQLEPLTVELGRHKGDARHVAAGSSEAIGNAAQDRISAEHIDHRDSCADIHQQAGSRTLSGYQINRQPRQLFREEQDAANIPVGIARGDREIATLAVPLGGKSGAECFEKWTYVCGRRSGEPPRDAIPSASARAPQAAMPQPRRQKPK